MDSLGLQERSSKKDFAISYSTSGLKYKFAIMNPLSEKVSSKFNFISNKL